MSGKYDEYIKILEEEKRKLCLKLEVISAINYISKILDGDINLDSVTISRESVIEFLKLLNPNEFINYVSSGNSTFYEYFLNFGNKNMLKLDILTHRDAINYETNIGQNEEFKVIVNYDRRNTISSSELKYEFIFSTLLNGDFYITKKDDNVILVRPNGDEIIGSEFTENDYSNLVGKEFSEAIKEISIGELLKRFKTMHPELMISDEQISKSDGFRIK